MLNMNPYGTYNQGLGYNYPGSSYGQNYLNYSGQPGNFSQNNGINWVQGMEAAKAYQLAPNSSIILLDSEQDRFYIKTTDNFGKCIGLRIFDFTEVTNGPTPQQPTVDMSDYVTHDELQEALRNVRGGKQNGKQFVQSNESNSK